MTKKARRNRRVDCASPAMRKKLDALGKALGAAMAEDLASIKRKAKTND